MLIKWYNWSFINIIQHKGTVNSLDRKWSACALATHSCCSLSCLQAAVPRCAFVLSSCLQLASYDSSLFLLTLTYQFKLTADLCDKFTSSNDMTAFFSSSSIVLFEMILLKCQICKVNRSMTKSVKSTDWSPSLIGYEVFKRFSTVLHLTFNDESFELL
jgi:hypothetical protein